MAGPSAATNFLSPEDYALMLRQAEQSDRAAQQQLQAPRHWTQALAGALGQGVSGYQTGQARERNQATQADANAQLAQLLQGGGNIEAAMANPRSAQQAFQYQAQAPQREFQQFKMNQAQANAPLERQALELGNKYKQAQIAVARRPKAPKWAKVGEDSAGQVIMGWVNPATGEVIPQPMQGISPTPTPGANTEQPALGGPGDRFSMAGQPPAGVDPNEYRKYASRESAKLVVEARREFPGIKGTAERMFGTIDNILTSPAFDRSTHPVTGLAPSFSGDAREFDSNVAQAQGGAFTQAFKEIKGGGAITEREGAAAEQALARLRSTTVGSANFKRALTDFKTELQKLVGIAAWKAGYESPYGSSQGDQGQGAQGQGAPKRRRWTPEKGLE